MFTHRPWKLEPLVRTSSLFLKNMRYFLGFFLLFLFIGRTQPDELQKKFLTEKVKFQQCMEDKNFSLQNTLDKFRECWDDFLQSLRSFEVTPQETDREKIRGFFETMCKAKDPIACIKIIEKPFEVCLSDKWKFALHHALVVFSATRSFICRDEGKRIADLFGRPSNEVCLHLISTNGLNCKVMVYKNSSMERFFSMYDRDDHCELEYKTINCIGNFVEHNCGSDFIQYYNEMANYVLKTSPCSSTPFFFYSGSSTATTSDVLIIAVLSILLGLRKRQDV